MDDEKAHEQAYLRAHEWNNNHPVGAPVLAWPGTRDSKPLRTRTRSSAWILGSEQVVASVVGHAGGISIDHIEHDPTRQPAVPDVSFEMPPCPICGTDLDSDGDSLTCYGCKASWQANGTHGTWSNPQAPRCLATARAYLTIPDTAVEQCVLAKDHDLGIRASPHRTDDGLTSWVDSDARAVLDGSGDAC